MDGEEKGLCATLQLENANAAASAISLPGVNKGYGVVIIYTWGCVSRVNLLNLRHLFGMLMAPG